MNDDKLKNVLKTIWGFDEFRPLQEEAMISVLENRDSLVVLPTGGGKSICFQAPALIMPGVALVVSPLISLMKDQVDALSDFGVQAAKLDSTINYYDQTSILNDAVSGRLKLLYLSPERLVSDRFLERIKGANISFIAIDEAHCISMWGHDFRPEYRMLARLKEFFPNAAIHAYTATATKQVRKDIASQLGLKEPRVYVGSFDRPNLIYKIERRHNVLDQVRRVMDRRRNESGIIYCIRRADVEELSSQLTNEGYSVLPYHAGMPDKDRKANQDAFIAEKVDVIVATVAFGMGIDKSNVRYVIHTGMPKSLEHYQQESGRAGRDGLDAECLLLYSNQDWGIWKTIITNNEPGAEDIAMEKLSRIFGFCTGVSCRHKSLVQYFGQNYKKTDCSACDICLGDLVDVKDSMVISQKILSCVMRLKEGFGVDYTAKVLIGSADKRVIAAGHDQLSTYGLLSDCSRKQVSGWCEQLIGQGYMKKNGEYDTLTVTPIGWDAMRGKRTPRLMEPGQLTPKYEQKKRKGVAAASWKGVDAGLFEALRKLRREIAERKGLPAYVVFGDETLRQMATYRPTSRENFLMIKGVGAQKEKQYGSDFRAAIREYCLKNTLTRDIEPQSII